jgi:cytochrome c-type biogenesis protein
MESSASLGVVVAFTAGVLSFLSPCVLPLIPSYVTFITGLSLEDASRARRTALVHALLFVAGFTLIFLALGATATIVGRVLLSQRVWISRVGGALVVLFGLYLLGAFNLSMLSRERRVHLADKPVGYLGTVLVGVTFGAGWTPCLGPILSAILVYTSTSADLVHGVGLLFAYSMGLALPFVLSAVAVERFLTLFARVRRQMAWVSRASGALLVVVGLMLMTNWFTALAGYLQGFTPAFLRSRL